MQSVAACVSTDHLLFRRYFGDEILKFRSWRELSAVAGDNTHMLRLDLSHLESVLIHHPGVETTLREIARKEKEKEEEKNRH